MDYTPHTQSVLQLKLTWLCLHILRAIDYNECCTVYLFKNTKNKMDYCIFMNLYFSVPKLNLYILTFEHVFLHAFFKRCYHSLPCSNWPTCSIQICVSVCGLHIQAIDISQTIWLQLRSKLLVEELKLLTWVGFQVIILSKQMSLTI